MIIEVVPGQPEPMVAEILIMGLIIIGVVSYIGIATYDDSQKAKKKLE